MKSRNKGPSSQAESLDREGAERPTKVPSLKRALHAAEQALLVSDASLQALLDTAVDAILTIDEVGRIESVNHATEQLFGYRAEELLTRNVKVLMPAPYRQEHDGYLANYRETGEKKIIGIGREVLAQRKNGEVFPIDLAVNEVTEAGRRRFMGVIRDVSARKQAEEALRQERDFAENLLDTAPVLVLVLGPDGRIRRTNRYLETLCGRDRVDLIGEHWIDALVAPRAAEQARDQRRESSGGGHGARSEWVLPLSRADGEERQIAWESSPLSGPDGDATSILQIGVDVSERIRLEEQFRRAEKMDAIGRLAGGIAHDFNTLLGSITGYSEMLLDRLGTDSATRRPAEQIYRCADRGAALTRQLLAFSRQHVVDPQVLDLGALITEMEDMLGRLIGDDIRLCLDIAPDTGSIHADAGHVEQVIMNLVVNAQDAMPRGGQVDIATNAVDVDAHGPEGGIQLEPGRYARITVRDTGCGMSAETRRRIFEPFFTTKEQGRGTGLGLATVYGIVQQSRGYIGVDSERDVGTAFHIYLPAAPDVEGTTSAPAGEAHPARTPRGAAATETILLVDDDPTFLELLDEVLTAKGYRVHAFSSPYDAQSLADALDEPPDLLISDIVMPGMNGTDLARHLVRNHATMRVLLMSGYNDEDLEARGAQSKHAAYIQKPFTTASFVGLVRDVLDGRAALGFDNRSGLKPEAER